MKGRTLSRILIANLIAALALLSPRALPVADAIPQATETPVTFAVIGDYGMDDGNELAVANLVASWNPSFVIATGDDYYAAAGGTGTAKYDESTGAYYCKWLKDIVTTGTRCPVGMAAVNAFFPALGNHDYSDATPAPETYLTYFTLPGAGFASTSGNERYYDFVAGPVHFFVLNSNTQEADGTSSSSRQAQWLQRQLAASTSPWNVVYDHHPPYSSDSSHGSTTYMQWPFATWGADVVISGHAHTYERIVRDGIVYFVNGLGGASRYNFTTPVTGSVARYSASWGAQKVTASDTALDLEFYNVTGALVDSYHLVIAPTAPPTAPSDLTATAVTSSQIDLAWTDSADNEEGFKIERSPDGATWAQIATVGANVRTYSNSGLSANTFFSYRVRAYNGGGNSTYSNVASTTTLGALSLHVGDLDGSRTLAKKNWAATVTIAVHDASHAPVSGALVSGSWSAGTPGSSSCTTNASGVCSVSKNNLKPTVTGVTYTVLSASKSGFSYLASSNHDSDGSSNGTTITVTK